MCGIAGFWNQTLQDNQESLERQVGRMGDQLVHRGPDGDGVWADETCGVALAHRRLSIIDLSKEGQQPMVSASGRYVIVYNGEIYNFRDLRPVLEEKGYKFRGQSDTEVLLAGLEIWGLEETLTRVSGMFAFAVWDKKAGSLHLARDRLGKKPLYYGWVGQSFVFASELKAIRAYDGFTGEVSRRALTAYLRHNYVPAPYAIYKGLSKLPPGTFMTVGQRGRGRQVSYWDIKAVAERGQAHSLHFDSPDDYLAQLDGLLTEAVGRRMISDVPLGAFLSGGIDSSLIVALMQKQADRPVKTFSIGFEESGYNEAEDAKKIAAHLGTDHTEFYVTADEARAVIPQLPEMFDEPFADPSQIPTYHVSRLARQHVTVALSGDGGDEGFGGYSRYQTATQLYNRLYGLPAGLRQGAARVLGALPVGGRVQKLASMMAVEDVDAFYRLMLSYWKDPAVVVQAGEEPLTAMTAAARRPVFDEAVHRFMYWDMVAYLPDDILVKVDRASMAVSLETRAPLLDYEVIEWAWQVPLALKVKDGQGKWLLRQLLGRYVPVPLFDRPKQGFGIPHGAWIEGPLRDWAEEQLSEKRLREEGYFDPVLVRKLWKGPFIRAAEWQLSPVGLLMFQAWQARWG